MRVSNTVYAIKGIKVRLSMWGSQCGGVYVTVLLVS